VKRGDEVRAQTVLVEAGAAMMEKLADLLIDTEAAYFEARARNDRERTPETRQALRAAQQRLDAAKAEADVAVWASARS
jgi:hypothetical protein